MLRSAGAVLFALSGQLTLAATALAQAGSGSSGFGGGRGGGGGGSGFGGGSGGSGAETGDPVVALIFFLGFGLFFVYGTVRSILYRGKVRGRDEGVQTASAEAAQDDAYFDASEFEAH